MTHRSHGPVKTSTGFLIRNANCRRKAGEREETKGACRIKLIGYELRTIETIRNRIFSPLCIGNREDPVWTYNDAEFTPETFGANLHPVMSKFDRTDRANQKAPLAARPGQFDLRTKAGKGLDLFHHIL
jgi:hypothetical protein